MTQALDLSYLDDLYVGHSLLAQALQQEQAAKKGDAASAEDTEQAGKRRHKVRYTFSALPKEPKTEVTREMLIKRLLHKLSQMGPERALEEAKKLGVTEGTLEALRRHAIGASDGENGTIIAHRDVGNFYTDVAKFQQTSIDGNQSMMIAGVESIKAKNGEMNSINQDLTDNIDQCNDTTGKAADATKRANDANKGFWATVGVVIAVVAITIVCTAVSCVMGPEVEAGAVATDSALIGASEGGAEVSVSGVAAEGGGMAEAGSAGDAAAGSATGEGEGMAESDALAEEDAVQADRGSEIAEQTDAPAAGGNVEGVASSESAAADNAADSAAQDGENQVEQAARAKEQQTSWLQRLRRAWSKDYSRWSKWTGRFAKYVTAPTLMLGSMGAMMAKQFEGQYRVANLNANLQAQSIATQVDSNLAGMLNNDINKDEQLLVKNPMEANQAASSQFSQIIGDLVKVENIRNN